MKYILALFLTVSLAAMVRSQEYVGLAVKTNLLSLVAKRPSFSVEKTFKQRYGLEFSYATGKLNIGREYEYSGFLLRGKMYAYEIKKREITPFFGAYIGSLDKTIVSNNAYTHPTGFLSFGNVRNFKANSFRSGVNLGFVYIPGKRFLLETTTGFGYGKYFDVETFQGSYAPKGYFDFQLWLSVGYRF
ncbi:DUF3575 domain-containing protein [Pedobacter agri]|uniref:DUF3575 domain-containing protein n=1 Tax=Pedobacter agri TaxID=454586 RepID=UPI00292EF154|nr:DUF3575 domain-containing protein [Pedobacter agri]